jgi:hypothetical protein
LSYAIEVFPVCQFEILPRTPSNPTGDLYGAEHRSQVQAASLNIEALPPYLPTQRKSDMSSAIQEFRFACMADRHILCEGKWNSGAAQGCLDYH